MFYEQLAKYYDVVFPLDSVKVAFLDREFKTVSAVRILDLACGTGTYTLALAKLGYEAVGTDLEPQMVDLAKEKAASQGEAVHFAVGDMREPQTMGLSFDGLFCIGNSLAHLTQGDDLARALRAMKGVLRSGGAAVFQVVNFDRILARGDTDLPFIERQGVSFRRTYRPQNEEKLVFESVLEVAQPSGECACYKSSVGLKPIRKGELEELILAAGFSRIKVYGDFKCGEYGIDSQAVVISAQC